MRKKSFFLVAGACLATLALTVGTAGADPMGPPPFRELAGTGADGPQGVMNGLSDVITINGTKVIGSYDAVGSAQITTKAPPANCTINRPTSGGQGIAALNASVAAGNGCLQFARQVTNDSQSRPGQNLTYIPYAIDALAYVIRDDSPLPIDLSLAELTSIYNCQLPGIIPQLGSFGAGTRRLFLERLGFTDAADFTSQPNHTCIQDGVSENRGILLTNPGNIAPHSIAQFLSQSNDVVPDVRGRTELGSINGVVPSVRNPDPGVGTVTYAIRDDGTAPINLSRAELQDIFNCRVPSPFEPLLPPPGASSRVAFLQQILGLPGDDPNFEATRACVPGATRPVRLTHNNRGILVTRPAQIAPYEIDVYLGQANRVIPDERGRTELGATDSINPAVLNNSSVLLREVFNVVPTGRIGAGTTENRVFVGPTSLMCAGTAAVIRRFGFNTNPSCGSTAIRTP